jgi:SAM-dependent methyltransferase
MSTWEWDETLFRGAAPHYTVGRLPYPDGLEDAIVEALGLDGANILLDVGCGPGVLALRLAARVDHAIGLDPDPGMLAEAHRLATARGITNVEWILARAEELADHVRPGSIRAATFGASFHWMDRDLVAALVHDALEPGGAFVHVGPGHPTDRPPSDVPVEEITALIERYLGSSRRAGQGIRLTSPSGEDEVLARLPYDGPQRVVVSGRPLERTPDQVIANVLSTSNAAPHLFGDRLERFTADLHALLDGRTYLVDQGDTLVRIWRKESGNSRVMADDRIDRRAAHLLPEEDEVGSDAPRAQAEAILEDSDERSADREAAPGSMVEHRTSDEATPPT